MLFSGKKKNLFLYLRYFIWLSAAVTLFLKNLLLFADSSFVIIGVGGSVDCVRCELVDGLRIIVIRKPSSAIGVLCVLWSGDDILRNDDVFIFGLLFDAMDDVDDGVGDRSDRDDTGLDIAESGVNRWDVDCVRLRGLKSSSIFSSVFSNIFGFDDFENIY